LTRDRDGKRIAVLQLQFFGDRQLRNNGTKCGGRPRVAEPEGVVPSPFL
jgi:hypothetical protein